jgi:hypothetical protein
MMDARRILFTIIGAIVAFFVFLAVAFYLYPIINPDAEFEGDTIGTIGYNPVDFSEFGPKVVADLKNRVSELERQLDEAVQKNLDYAEKVQILGQQLEEAQTMAGAGGMLAGNMDGSGLGTTAGPGGFGAPSDSVIKRVKALFALDDEEMMPILNMLDASQLLEIYQQASNRQREQMLRVLAPPKASSLLKKVMS